MLDILSIENQIIIDLSLIAFFTFVLFFLYLVLFKDQSETFFSNKIVRFLDGGLVFLILVYHITTIQNSKTQSTNDTFFNLLIVFTIFLALGFIFLPTVLNKEGPEDLRDLITWIGYSSFIVLIYIIVTTGI